ncbi:rRNA accumulation- protein [Yamadazyma tenuis]|uniref:Pre-rRNA-processing protein TSR2 n=1 Tax=Candida tenuis (strain ATCC 10573 / BCRC 21748 / CBS 615 / JCM 9827 / NBRC 10315 / NRRL Y-1498 / VKM Y-70) TaxID=590646 RepID=G3AY52_CANTC|nr:uncharacterized protein CANTEDRAFT_112636 [Yamadazyma tenuis ATCC 10573]XP_006684745.1 uncharacterized protein CANTEDRAFT_112636 [Yamadazyma tenuis ATCC 10573]EGV66170.1 hypothetical protein CANTEDRAFT_112636 [Yamadazyma tenuis ATCC 10573]EGV66171.1 hypothetical protein CANTEDRAFT_112636 [Yamadazyma tenuis ATCC 10573]WEJ95908.1 rRNA accumulation- protein [Yamadazyma tenuis]
MSRIDPTEFVQALDGQSSLKFPNERQQSHFELGVTMAVHKWEELNVAVDNSWGGPNSADKRDWISGIVIDLFEEKIVDVQLVEETLLYAMLDEFDVHVDNDSALEIANMIIKFYQKAQLNDFSDIDILYERWQIRQQNRQAQKVKVEDDPENPSSDEEDDEEHEHYHEDQHIDDSMEVDNGPVVDDDGFTLVQTKKGNRRR